MFYKELFGVLCWYKNKGDQNIQMKNDMLEGNGHS